MEQRTLSDLLRIKGMDCEMTDFDPNPAVEAWLLGAKTKRHAMKRGHDAPGPVVVPTDGPYSVSEPFQALPPMPELPQIDSSSDSDSE